MELADAETERWRRKFGMSRARVRAHGGGDGDRLLGDRRRDGAARFGNYALAAQHRHDRTPATSSGTASDGPRDAAATCRASSSSTCSPTTSTPRACGGSPTRRSTRSSRRSGRRRRRRPATSPASREDGSIRGGGAGEIDPIENLSRFHYLKELFLDSATTMTVLSCVPTSPDTDNPLPLAEAARDGRHGQRRIAAVRSARSCTRS